MATSLHEAHTPTEADKALERPARILVNWEENEAANPLNWPTPYKAWITVQLGMLAMAASVGSSIMAPTEPTLEEVFNISHEVSVLCISLYMFVTTITRHF